MGAAWGRAARAGWVLGLAGDLGAGKTHLVKGIARGCGLTVRVHSPTFTLLNDYEDSPGGLRVSHLDLYRLNGPADVFGAGLDPWLIEPAGIAVIEWIERWLGPLPVPADGIVPAAPLTPLGRPFRGRLAWLELIDEHTRHIRYEDFGG